MPSLPNVVGSALLLLNQHTKNLYVIDSQVIQSATISTLTIVCRITDIERVNNTRESLPESNDDLIRQCKAMYPGMKTMEAWAAERAKQRNESQPRSNWNNVSILRLLTGKM